MELMLTVGISPGERTKGIVEREAEKRGTGREILKDLTQLILTDFCYVYRVRKEKWWKQLWYWLWSTSKSTGCTASIDCLLHNLQSVLNMLNMPKGYDQLYPHLMCFRNTHQYFFNYEWYTLKCRERVVGLYYLFSSAEFEFNEAILHNDEIVRLWFPLETQTNYFQVQTILNNLLRYTSAKGAHCYIQTSFHLDIALNHIFSFFKNKLQLSLGAVSPKNL